MSFLLSHAPSCEFSYNLSLDLQGNQEGCWKLHRLVNSGRVLGGGKERDVEMFLSKAFSISVVRFHFLTSLLCLFVPFSSLTFSVLHIKALFLI